MTEWAMLLTMWLPAATTLFPSVRVQFHLETTSVQIHVVIQSRHHEFHRSDARGGRIDGNHTIAIVKNVRLGHFEQIKAGIDLQIGAYMSHISVSHDDDDDDDSIAFASVTSTFIPLFEIAYHVINGWFGHRRRNPTTSLTRFHSPPLSPLPPPVWFS